MPKKMGGVLNSLVIDSPEGHLRARNPTGTEKIFRFQRSELLSSSFESEKTLDVDRLVGAFMFDRTSDKEGF